MLTVQFYALENDFARGWAMAVIDVERMSHLGVKVVDLDRAIEFYERVLGWELALDYRNGALPGHETVVGIAGGMAIELIHDDQPLDTPPQPDGYGFSCVSFSVVDVDAASAALRAAGVEVIGPIPFPLARAAFFRDPDGNLLEVIQLPGGARSLADAARR